MVSPVGGWDLMVPPVADSDPLVSSIFGPDLCLLQQLATKPLNSHTSSSSFIVTSNHTLTYTAPHNKPEVWCLKMPACQIHIPVICGRLFSGWHCTHTCTQNREPLTQENSQEPSLIRSRRDCGDQVQGTARQVCYPPTCLCANSPFYPIFHPFFSQLDFILCYFWFFP